MDYFDSTLKSLDAIALDSVAKELKTLTKHREGLRAYITKWEELNEDYLKTGVMRTSPVENWEDFIGGDKPVDQQRSSNRSSIKENIEPLKNEESNGRPRRNASKACAKLISDLVNLPLNTKLRRTRNATDTLQNSCIKQEKLSICPEDPPTNGNVPYNVEEVNVKTEVEEMPAPARPAPRKKKQRGASKIQVKQEKIEQLARDSDVIIENVPVPVINLNDSDLSLKSVKEEPKRTTRTKTKRQKAKRSRTHSSEDEDGQSKDKRSKSVDDNKTATNEIDYTDAVSMLNGGTESGKFEETVTLMNVNDASDATFIASKNTVQPSNLNSTVVVENPKYVKNMMPQTMSDLMTDDESEEESKRKSPPKTKRAIPKAIKQIFSPFDQSPVKKKVQAFEKFKEEANAMPPRQTRTKTRAQAKHQEENETEITEEIKSNVKEKAKLFTPMGSKFMPKAVSTSLRPKTGNISTSNESVLSAKSASALKASQAEYREREKRRREKEEEALKKREAILQAQVEEKKRRREEKQLKAQQQREALEKDKLKALEIQKQKDERHKQIMAEQEEKKIKQKEEMEKKRQMAKMKAIEEKKKEEERRLEEQKKTEELAKKLSKQDDLKQMLQKQKQQTLPVYMKFKAPLLPTTDCYDTDDERYDPDQRQLPNWGTDKGVQQMQKIAFAAGEAVKNTFFSIQAQTPDLQDIFVVIEQKKLKRTSSAVWRKAPRFTMIPGLENHDETEEFDDD